VRARTLSILLIAAAAVLPAPAAAHEEAQPELTASERHHADDLAGVSVPTLERQVRARTNALGLQPGTRAATERLAATVDPGLVGSWSPVMPAPVVPIFEALLPNGKILMWDSVGDAPAESYADQSFTRAAVYDPRTNTSKRVDVAGSNLFCAGFVQLANGNVFVAGGNADSVLHGSRHTHIFDWRSETWARGPDMQDGRWYPSVGSMPNDEALIIGGGPTVAEIRTRSGSLRRLANVVTPTTRDYPFFQAALDGRALLLGPTRALSLVDPSGLGALTPFGDRDAINRTYGSYAPYDIGRFLVAGGGAVSEDGLSNVPTRTAVTVDTRSGTPRVTASGSMNRRRRQHTLTVLADGSVLATGGQSTMGGNGQVDLANAVYTAERWNPATGSWTELAAAAVARQYHSSALLLPDGRVLTGGGGICSVCQQVGYLRRDLEIYTPPYLYRKDASGALAARPQIGGAPSAIAYTGTFTLSSPQATSIRKVGLLRLGAPTHSQDQSQRYVPLGFSASGTTLTVAAPNNPNEAPAGHYMLFAVDAAGVPSVSAIVALSRTVAAESAPGNLARGRPATSSTPCATTEGPEKAVNGSVSGGRSDKFCTNVADRWLQVDLGSNRTISTFVVKHSGAGGEPVAYNTRDYRFETRAATGPWTAPATVTGNTASVTTTTIAPRTARFVRLRVSAGEQANAAGPARIFEFEVYSGNAPGDAAAAPLIAYSGLDATGRAQRFEVGAYEAARGNLGLVGADATRSVEIASGYRGTLCRDAGLLGCTTLATGRSSPLPAGLDLSITSLRVTRAP
jgi:hypothetical protein